MNVVGERICEVFVCLLQPLCSHVKSILISRYYTWPLVLQLHSMQCTQVSECLGINHYRREHRVLLRGDRNHLGFLFMTCH